MKLTTRTLMATLFSLAALSLATGASARDRDDGPGWGHQERSWQHQNRWDNRHERRWNERHHVRDRDRVVFYGAPVVYAPPVVYRPPVVYSAPYYRYAREPSVTIGFNLPPIIIR